MESSKAPPLTYQGRELDLAPTNCHTANVVSALLTSGLVVNVTLEPGDATHYEFLIFRMGPYSTPERGGFRQGSIAIVPVSSLSARKNLFVIDPAWETCTHHDFEEILNEHTRSVYAAFVNGILERLRTITFLHED